MELTNSQEEYLKTIYILEKNNKKVRVTDIAIKLNITKPSVNKAINLLKDLNLIDYKAYGNIKLTDLGKNLSKEIIKKQDILKMFLVEILEVEEIQAEEEAKLMKHSMSKKTIKKLDQYISKVMNLEEVYCEEYDESSEKCKNCIKITATKMLKKKNFGG